MMRKDEISTADGSGIEQTAILYVRSQIKI